MKVLTRILFTLAAGLLITGLAIGFANQVRVDGSSCGSAFAANSNNEGGACDYLRSEQRPLPMALIGLALTLAVAALVVDNTATTQALAARNTPPAP